MAEDNSSTEPDRRNLSLIRMSVRVKIVITLLSMATASASAYALFDEYLPFVSKYQVKVIVDQRNSLQTEELSRSLGGPLRSVISSVDKIIHSGAVDRCERTRDNVRQIDGRIFDLERLTTTAVTPEVRVELERRVRAMRIELDVARNKASEAAREMQRVVGWSC